MSAPTFNEMLPRYRDLIDTMVLRPELETDVQWYVDRIMANRPRYKAIESTTGVPWYWIGAVHGRESSFNFSGHLHNGDPLTGRTYHVPAGRLPNINPPYTFEQSAQDALEMKGLQNVTDWSAERMAYEFERYNGWGYHLYRDINSPYLWSGSNHYHRGKYVADGTYDRDAIDKQMGTMAMVYLLSKQAPIDIHRHGEAVTPTPPPYAPPPTPSPWPYEPPRQWQEPEGQRQQPEGQRPQPEGQRQQPEGQRPQPPTLSKDIEDALADKLKGTIKSADLMAWIPRLLAIGAVGGAAITISQEASALKFDKFIESLQNFLNVYTVFTAVCFMVLGFAATRFLQIWMSDD